MPVYLSFHPSSSHLGRHISYCRRIYHSPEEICESERVLPDYPQRQWHQLTVLVDAVSWEMPFVNLTT